MLQALCTASLLASVVASSVSYIDPQRWLCNLAFLLNLVGCAGALTGSASLSQPENGRIGQYIATLLPTIAAALLSMGMIIACWDQLRKPTDQDLERVNFQVQLKSDSDSFCRDLLASIVVGIHDCIVCGELLMLALISELTR